MKTFPKFLLTSIVIIILSLLAIYPTFSLALFGDDWLAFFRFKQHVDPGSGQWNYLTYFLTPYGAQDILMGILYKVSGLNSPYYYLISYFLRMVAAFSLYPLVFYLTKSKISAFSTVAFFALTVIGFDATNWVFNMPTYITISLFFICLYFFISAREEKPKSRLIFSALLYYLAYITTPIRMHGSLVLIFLLEIFWVLQNRSIKTLKIASLRFLLMFLVFLVVRFAGNSQGPSNEASERFMLGITATQNLLSQGRFDFLFYPVVMIGSMVVPDLMLIGTPINSYKQILLTGLPIFLISGIFISMVLKIVGKLKTSYYAYIFLSLIIWSFLASIIARGNLTTFGNSSLITLLLIGGYTIILAVSFLIYFFRQKSISTLLFISLGWVVFSFFFAWWWVPTSLFPTTYRYLIVSAAGVAILFGGFISLGKTQSSQLLLFLLLIPFIFINILSLRLYLNILQVSHGQEVTDKIWSSIPYVPEVKTSREPFIFYFEGDGTNGGTLHDVITFGFPPHMALLYGLTAADSLPVPMSDINEVVSAVTDGKPMPAYGYKIEPIDVERVYAFHLQGQNNLIDITNVVREKLKEVKKQSSKD